LTGGLPGGICPRKLGLAVGSSQTGQITGGPVGTVIVGRAVVGRAVVGTAVAMAGKLVGMSVTAETGLKFSGRENGVLVAIVGGDFPFFGDGFCLSGG